MSDKTDAFLHSKTKENLMRAFAGECQAQNRYAIAAGIAREAGLAVLEGVFRFTARQEAAHARLFYRELADLRGQTVRISEGTYPVDLYSDPLSLLKAAQHNEYQEWEHDYTRFARTAMDEGFPLVNKLFENVARAEKVHGDRFGRFADLLEREQLFRSGDERVQWTCLHCGWVVESTAAPAQCPVCRHSQGYFLRADLRPWL